MSKKIAHGRYSIEYIQLNNLITCELSGTFNKEGMDAWILAMRSTIEPIKYSPFGLVIDARSYAGGTEEALQSADNFHQWLILSMLVCQAHVISSPTLYSISLRRLPSLKHHVVKSFLRIDEASVWVTEQLEGQANVFDKVR
ncbi:hypothetical protein [Aeromonas bestiarum]|uniref:hypothetical protein n=1 Tax=Aeromonas bestiarum TaxID=105751 RepID=UPI00103EF36D|nr:hypothetical protein [Aeromonas bestiarum]